ncbi:MAG: metallophosphoesterase [Candidatus Zixiibacteriota bacterium]|nr:MAG: metallophosphoesterase [candidate division Zixibacteria bacterium]
MESQQVAVISDVHGNRWALRAVLDDITARGVGSIISLGDNAYGPLDPGATISMMLEHRIMSVSGNEDSILTERGSPDRRAVHREYTLDNLDPQERMWLGQLEMTLYLHENICLCHATPNCNETYLLHKVTAGGVVARPDEEILSLLHPCRARTVVCGHSHIPGLRTAGERTVIDVGSVGLQAYVDDMPYPHRMETGDPLARYTILSFDAGRCDARMYEVMYDWDSAADVAGKNGAADWEHWLRAGQIA